MPGMRTWGLSGARRNKRRAQKVSIALGSWSGTRSVLGWLGQSGACLGRARTGSRECGVGGQWAFSDGRARLSASQQESRLVLSLQGQARHGQGVMTDCVRGLALGRSARLFLQTHPKRTLAVSAGTARDRDHRKTAGGGRQPPREICRGHVRQRSAGLSRRIRRRRVTGDAGDARRRGGWRLRPGRAGNGVLGLCPAQPLRVGADVIPALGRCVCAAWTQGGTPRAKLPARHAAGRTLCSSHWSGSAGPACRFWAPDARDGGAQAHGKLAKLQTRA